MAEGYELICKIGEGTFGEVYKARRVRDGVSVALKKLRIRRAQHGLPQIVLREIKALQHIRHANVRQQPSRSLTAHHHCCRS